MSVRKVVFWAHLAAGCIAALIIFLMSATGVLLTYQRQMLASNERGPFRSAPPSAGATRLSPETLLARVIEQRAVPAGASLTLRSDAAEPAELSAGNGPVMYVNPYTGRVLGSPDTGMRETFRSIVAWHRWLGQTGEGRDTARLITGTCNLAFLVLIVTGAYLWLPRVWTWPALRPIIWFRGGLAGKARDFNWHNVFGLWGWAGLFVVVLTAVPMSFSWANRFVYRMAGSPLPESQRAPERKASAPPNLAVSELAGLDASWQQAETTLPGWQSIAIRLPRPEDKTLAFTLDAGDGGQPQRRATLTLDRATAQIVRRETFDDLSRGRQWRSYARFLHTGEALGLTGQTIAGMASLAGVMLTWTGVSLSLRRFLAWRKRRGSAQRADAAMGAVVSEELKVRTKVAAVR